jgi:hypothetical protein
MYEFHLLNAGDVLDGFGGGSVLTAACNMSTVCCNAAIAAVVVLARCDRSGGSAGSAGRSRPDGCTMLWQRSTHSLQMWTVGPAISLATLSCDLPQAPRPGSPAAVVRHQ